MALTPKRQRFVREYLIDLNATKAAERAGYSKRSAYTEGSRLLENAEIQAEVTRLRKAQLEKIEITAERVLQEIAKMAFFDPRKLFDAEGKPIPIQDLDDVTAASIAGLDVSTAKLDEVVTAAVLKYKLADKRANLELLGRNLRLFTDKIVHEVTDNTADALQAARERALGKVGGA